MVQTNVIKIFNPRLVLFGKVRTKINFRFFVEIEAPVPWLVCFNTDSNNLLYKGLFIRTIIVSIKGVTLFTELPQGKELSMHFLSENTL